MTKHVAHKETLPALNRIEGQVKGVKKMIKNKKYCMDIITQIHAATKALYRVSEDILAKHIEQCVVKTFTGKSKLNKKRKISEIMSLVKKLHNMG